VSRGEFGVLGAPVGCSPEIFLSMSEMPQSLPENDGIHISSHSFYIASAVSAHNLCFYLLCLLHYRL
jgi:hypothetical protein